MQSNFGDQSQYKNVIANQVKEVTEINLIFCTDFYIALRIILASIKQIRYLRGLPLCQLPFLGLSIEPRAWRQTLEVDELL